MPRLTAGALTAAHHDHLVTVSTETGESITMTLHELRHGYMNADVTSDEYSFLTTAVPAVGIRGTALGQDIGLCVPHWQPVHVFTDDVSPTAKADRLAELARVGFPVRGDGA